MSKINLMRVTAPKIKIDSMDGDLSIIGWDGERYSDKSR